MAQGAIQERSPQKTAAAVEEALIADWAVPAEKVQVSVRNGVVTLQGEVGNLLARERAGQIAEAIRDVRAVINRIQVEPVSRKDADLRSNVIVALKQDPVVDADQIEVQADVGAVTLSGVVGSLVEQRAAMAATMRVRGVRRIDNELAFAPDPNRNDDEIEAEIERRLRYDALVAHEEIQVEVTNGQVRLSGRVPCAWERRRAVRDAAVPGVVAIDEEALRIDPQLEDPTRQRSGEVRISDGEIERAVTRALLLDPRVPVELIEIDVHRGIVTMYGEVGRAGAARAAEEDARSTVGVVHVINNLRVKPTNRPSDEWIRMAASQALERNVAVDADSIQVEVLGGLVYLFGTVPSFVHMREAVRTAEDVQGAAAVLNNLHVDAAPGVDSDAELRQHVQWLLRGSPLVQDGTIVVAARAGTVTLHGEAKTWTARAAAERFARRAGALRVVNRIEVAPPKGR